MKLNNNLYDALKFIVTKLVPALIVLVTTIGTALGYVEEIKLINVILTALGTFIASLIGLSYYVKKDEPIEVKEEPKVVNESPSVTKKAIEEDIEKLNYSLDEVK